MLNQFQCPGVIAIKFGIEIIMMRLVLFRPFVSQYLDRFLMMTGDPDQRGRPVLQRRQRGIVRRVQKGRGRGPEIGRRASGIVIHQYDIGIGHVWRGQLLNVLTFFDGQKPVNRKYQGGE